MTLPHESARAVVMTRRFLFELLDPQKTPRVPGAIRRRAGELLRHYPWGPGGDEQHPYLKPNHK